MAKRTFEQWVDCLFDHPVTDPQWYFQSDADTGEEEDAINAGYLARLFNESDVVLARFDDAQVNQGIWMIADPGGSDHYWSIVESEAPWPVKREAIRAIYNLYAKCFAMRCSPTLAHLNEPSPSLNSICYMWWDVLPSASAGIQPDAEAEYLSVLERCLTIPHDACIEGALHGLGHWQTDTSPRVAEIIDHFLNARPNLRPELIEYARRARVGAVQ